MATFKICIRKGRTDGYYPVYIRVTHNRKTTYIKTDKMVDKKGLNKAGDIKDNYVLAYCSRIINEYTESLNKADTRYWDLQDVVTYLQNGDEDVCFSDFSRRYIMDMRIKLKQERNAKNYQLALKSLELFAGTNELMCSRFTYSFVRDWIDTLASTARAKEMYPVCVRMIYKAAMAEYNDAERGIVRIKTNPWEAIKIPKADKSEHRAIPVEQLRKLLYMPLPPSQLKLSREGMAKDVCWMVIGLAGINTVDLYSLRKSNMNEWTITYNRSKTKKFRRDEARLEITVPEIIRPLFDKYRTDEADEFLLSFHTFYSDADSFNSNINGHIKKWCEYNNRERFSIYNLRHSWGTIARNDIKASMDDVAFALNHSSAHRVTEIYVKQDYSIVTDLNNRVVDYILNNHLNPMGYAAASDTHQFKLSYKQMIRGQAIYNGVSVASIMDLGYSNVDAVIDRLIAALPSFIPDGAMVEFCVENIDEGESRTYRRQRGKGC